MRESLECPEVGLRQRRRPPLAHGATLWRFVQGLLLLGVVGCVATLPPAATIPAMGAEAATDVVLYSEDLEDGEAQGWDLPSGWAVVSEGSGKILRGAGPEISSYRGDAWDDYTFSLRFRLNKGKIQVSYRLGQCVRYIVAVDLESVELKKEDPCGECPVLARRSLKLSARKWYSLNVAGSGDVIRVVVDGTQRLEYTDASPLLGGGIGVETLDESDAYFDDLRVLGRATPTESVAGGQWARTGGPPGGIGYDIRMRPDNPDVMYATDAQAGLHRSTDGGRTWESMNEGIEARGGPSGDAIPVFSVSIDPNNHDTVWVGLQGQRGIYRSVDAGHTWAKRVNGIVEQTGLTIRGIAVEPGNSDVVYAAGEIESAVWAGRSVWGWQFDRVKGVVYKSTDAGLHWSAA